MRRLDRVGLEGPLGPYAAGFTEWLIGQGYAISSVSHHLGAMGWLSRWLAVEDLGPDALSEVVVHRFRAGQGTLWTQAAGRGDETAADLSSRAAGGTVGGTGAG